MNKTTIILNLKQDQIKQESDIEKQLISEGWELYKRNEEYVENKLFAVEVWYKRELIKE